MYGPCDSVLAKPGHRLMLLGLTGQHQKQVFLQLATVGMKHAGTGAANHLRKRALSLFVAQSPTPPPLLRQEYCDYFHSCSVPSICYRACGITQAALVPVAVAAQAKQTYSCSRHCSFLSPAVRARCS